MNSDDLYSQVDLDDFSIKHKKEFRKFAGIVEKCISAYVIMRDLLDAQIFSNMFYDAHMKVRYRREIEHSDNNNDGMLASAIFIAGLSRLARAMDDTSKGRKGIDFHPTMKNAGLEEDYALLKKFRNEELSHFDRFEHDASPYSAHTLVLSVGHDQSFWLDSVYSRHFSKGYIINAALKIIPLMYDHARDTHRKCVEQIISEISNDKNLLIALQAYMENNRFEPAAFFRPVHPNGILPSWEPTPPIGKADWHPKPDE